MTRRYRAVLVTRLLCLISLAGIRAGALAGTGTKFRGQVVGISDGDTISVMRDGRAEKIRLHCGIARKMVKPSDATSASRLRR